MIQQDGHCRHGGGLLLLVILFVSSPLHAAEVVEGTLHPGTATLQPANRNASPEAHAVLRYLESLTSKKEKRIISGQFESWGQANKPLDDPENWNNQVYRQTGKWPGVVGVEYHAGGVHTKEPNAVCLEHWRRGGLVQLYLIMRNPAAPKNPNASGRCDIDLVLKKGHPYNTVFFKELGEVAAGLKELQRKRVVVFVNMFAEHTGKWFWWGAQETEKFKRLHRAAFTFLTETHGLDNLLFIYEPSGGHKTAVDYYPGDRYVDMIGISLFVNNTEELQAKHIPMYKRLVALGKPIALDR